MRKRIIVKGIIIIFLLLILVSTSFAASDQEKIDLEVENPETLSKTTNIGGLLLRYIVSVLGVVFLTYIGVKYFGKKLEPPTMAGNWIQIIDQMSLGTNKGIFLVEIEGKGFVLGVTDQQINVITTIEQEQRLDELRELTLSFNKKPQGVFNILKTKKSTDFHSSLMENIKYTQKLSNKNEGNSYHED